MQKLQWIFRLIKSRTYVLLTDNGAVVSIPLTEVNTFKNYHLLAAQTASLQEFKVKLDEVITLHEQAIDRITGTKPKRTNKRKPNSNATRVRQTKRPARKQG